MITTHFPTKRWMERMLVIFLAINGFRIAWAGTREISIARFSTRMVFAKY